MNRFEALPNSDGPQPPWAEQSEDKERLVSLMTGDCGRAEVMLDLFEQTYAADAAAREAERPTSFTARQPGIEGAIAWGQAWQAPEARERRNLERSMRAYRHLTLFTSAECFVTYLARVRRTIDILARYPGAPPSVKEAGEAIDRSLHRLKDVRDSVEHMEDRVRSMARKNKRTAKIEPMQSVTVIGSLFDRTYMILLRDGEHAAIAISDVSLSTIVEAVRAIVISAFKFPAIPSGTEGADRETRLRELRERMQAIADAACQEGRIRLTPAAAHELRAIEAAIVALEQLPARSPAHMTRSPEELGEKE